MRAHTITTMTRPTPKVWRRAVALVCAVCALVIPASASADSGYSSVNAITSSGGGGLAERTVTELGQRVESADTAIRGDSRYSSVNAIGGPPPGEPTIVSGAPSGSDDGFQWGDAALGAGAALALLALGGTVLLTVRRRTAVSPTTASMG